MEKPLFYQGQRVVAQVQPAPKGWKNNPAYDGKVIDGKSYYVANPSAKIIGKLVFIELAGMKDLYFWQQDFIPHDTDQALDEEIHQALKEDLKVKNFQDN